MPGANSGLKVLDLSWGISGPMAAMIMGDSGADVIKVEKPGGDPFRASLPLGYKTWQRGKRSVELDLTNEADLAVFKNLAAGADVLIESFAPGTTARLGIDYATLSKINPRLIYLSITAYGRDRPDSHRKGYDLLVAARTGLMWEHRGWPETAMSHMTGTPDLLADLETDYSVLQGPPRPGPIVTASPAASLGAFYSAVTAIHAALIARDNTGRGQWVETSLLQGAIAAAMGVWLKAENSERPGFNSWIFGMKGPKGQFQTADSRWVHNWVPNPRFILGASERDTINASPDLTVQNDPDRFGMAVEESFVITHYQPILAERMAKFTADEWYRAAALADVPLQEVRSVEEAYADPLLLADGCVRELDDPELGPLRQPGVMVNMEKSVWQLGGAAPSVGQHNAEVRAEAAAAKAAFAAPPPSSASGKAPLAGIKVLDLGLAIAGPFGTQQLADLGAEVIKINTLWDGYWHGTGVSMTSNRNKRSLCMDLKRPEAMAILHKLVAQADIVQHNMRYEAAVRLGVDYDSLKQIKPDLIYCHTRGHERGPREVMPGNDQTGACVAGVQYEDGGVADGGRPLWSLTSFGDTGNGWLSALGMMQALRHRQQTGEGQYVDTSIVNAQLLNISYVLGRPDGSGFDRPRLDKMATGMTALYGIYETADGWIAIAAVTEAEWQALSASMGISDARFATAAERWKHDKPLRAILAEAFKAQSAAGWFAELDAAGAPCEVVDPEGGRKIMADPELKQRKWVAAYRQELVGDFEQSGLGYDFSDTPGELRSAPLVVGDSTAQILAELGYSDAEVADMAGQRIVGLWAPGEALVTGVNSRLNVAKQAAAAE